MVKWQRGEKENRIRASSPTAREVAISVTWELIVSLEVQETSSIVVHAINDCFFSINAHRRRAHTASIHKLNDSNRICGIFLHNIISVMLVYDILTRLAKPLEKYCLEKT